MEENFYNDGFEEFLQRQVKDQRMFPADGVWRNIYKSLHGDTYWPALTVAAFAFLAAIIAISVYFSPSPDIFSSVPPNKTGQASTAQTGSNKNDGAQKSNLLTSIPNDNSSKSSSILLVENPNAANSSIAETVIETTLVALERSNSAPTTLDETLKSKIAGTITQAGTSQNLLAEKSFVAKPGQAILIPVEILPATEATEKIITEDLQSTSPSSTGISKEDAAKIVKEDVQLPVNATASTTLNKQKARKNRFGYLVYITPSRSYRKLTQEALNDGTFQPSGPLAQSYVLDVNQVVRHKPGSGIEAGFSFLYSITDKLKIKTGLQYNVRQYSMEAFLAPMEVATIALKTRNGFDSVSSYAIYRTSNGFSPTEITNRYYQVSIPVGVEWQVIGNKTIQLNVAASVQPTYLSNRTTYLLSTDFKNYAASSEFTRGWNINTNLETFVSIKSGDFKWQIGPQFRYQNLPTFISAYPIHEHLIDYGVKLGVSKSIK